MNRTSTRLLLGLYIALMLLCGWEYATWDNYQMDGDGIAFMDISDAMLHHDWARVPNGYWNPLYSFALAVGQMVSHPTRTTELRTFYHVNFVIFALCLAVSVYFALSLARLRGKMTPLDNSGLQARSLVPVPALILATTGLMFYSFQRELSLAKVRADSLLYFSLILAASFLMRLISEQKFVYYPLLGFALGLAYLTKSFAFLPTGFLLASIFIYGITRKDGSRNRILAGSVLAGVVFIAIATPYIVAISKQRGRLTTGESARLNYAFFVDQTPRWHEWRTGDLGHATADFQHHEALLMSAPYVYTYQQHPFGTYPLWFDAAYWTDTIHPQFWLQGHLERLRRCTQLMARYLLGHPESLLLLGVLLFVSGGLRSRRVDWLPFAPVMLWGLLMLCIYFPIDLQDRYLTPAFFMIVLPPLAFLTVPAEGIAARKAATAAALLLALLSLFDGTRDVLERRRVGKVTGYANGGAYSRQIFPAAEALKQIVPPGAAVACMGDDACYVDHYWARVAGTQILTEVEVPGDGDPRTYWQSLSAQKTQEIAETLHSHGASAIVALFRSGPSTPPGWQQLGTSDFYAYALR